MTNKTLTIRRASDADTTALQRLAAIDSAAPPTDDTLLAEVSGEIWAAVGIESGEMIADPFRPSGEMVDLLRFRADRLQDEAGRGARMRLRLPRAA